MTLSVDSEEPPAPEGAADKIKVTQNADWQRGTYYSLFTGYSQMVNSDNYSVERSMPSILFWQRKR